MQNELSLRPTAQPSWWDRIGQWFGLSYWASAAVQFVGTTAVFWLVGGSLLHALAGALCVELMILSLNNYGVKQTGAWQVFIALLSLMLVAASGAFQVAELLSQQADPVLAARLGAERLAFMRFAVPVAPSVAMGIVTLIKFVDARRGASEREADLQALIQTLRDQLVAATDGLNRANAIAADATARNAELETRTVAQANELQRLQGELQAAITGGQRLRDATASLHGEMKALQAQLQDAKRETPATAQLQGGVSWDEALQQLGAAATPTTMHKLTGVSVATASRRLRKEVKV